MKQSQPLTTRDSKLKGIYQLCQKIGKGAYSEVFRAIRITCGSVFAVKVVKLSSHQPELRTMVRQQVAVMASLRGCRFVVQLQESWQQAGSIYIAMELAEKGDLRSTILQRRNKRKHFEEKQIWRYLAQLLQGVQYLHKLKMIHRDIKSSNILVAANGSLKLSDFNLVAGLEGARGQVGTLRYMSPEVLKLQQSSQQSDLWAIGCVLYQLATLAPPFKGSNLQILLNRISHSAIKPLPIFYSSALDRVVHRLLSPDPKERPSVEQLLALHPVVPQVKVSNYSLRLDIATTRARPQKLPAIEPRAGGSMQVRDRGEETHDNYQRLKLIHKVIRKPVKEIPLANGQKFRIARLYSQREQ